MSRLTYRIRDWDRHFENSQSRKYQSISWVAIPNKHDGKSFRRLMRRPDGCALYGCWVLIVQVASKCPVRGVLADVDGPLDAEDISLKCDAPTALVAEALAVLSAPEIGWLTTDPLPACSEQTGSTLVAGSESATLNYPEENRTERPSPTPPTPKSKRSGPTSGAGKSSGAGSQGIDPQDLKDPDKIQEWLQSNGPSLHLDPEDFDTQVNVLAAAIHARNDGDKPGGVFVANVRNARWKSASDDEIAEAKRVVTARRRPPDDATVTAAVAALGLVTSLPMPAEDQSALADQRSRLLKFQSIQLDRSGGNYPPGIRTRS